MDHQQPLVSIPFIPYYCNLVVFPSPHKTTVSRFFILSNSAATPECSDDKVTFDYIPGSVYCFLPSSEKAGGKITVLSGQPSFVHDFTFPYCLELNPQALVFISSEKKDTSKSPGSQVEPRKCIKCFISHFPSPNTVICKWNKNKKDKMEKPWPVRLRGGAGNRQDMIDKAVNSAKVHGINIHAGVENLANGNCIFESVIDSINTRASFEEHLDESPDYYRHNWMAEVEDVAYEDWNNGMTRAEWSAGWQVLKEPRAYEYELGDLVLPGIAHYIKKDIVIFNTSPNAHCPVYVVEASKLCGTQVNNDIPIC